MNARRIPDATVDRLPVYLRVLLDLGASGQPTVSSDQLAELAGVNAAKVRKDLSHLGSYGTRGVGYDVEYLRFEITSRLGLAVESPVVIVGLGNLGRALASHGGFRERGFIISGLYDSDPEKVGTEVAGVEIRPIDALGSARDLDAAIGVIAPTPASTSRSATSCATAGGVAITPIAASRSRAEPRASMGRISTPAAVAQDVADLLVDAGVGAILNFAPTVISVPDSVALRKVDLSLELQVLSFYRQRSDRDSAPAERR